jgi:hypothetical protein
MKVLSKVQKPQFERRGRKLYIRYSESQLSSFTGDTITDFTPETETKEDETTLSYQQVVIPVSSNRDNIISALINDRYSKDAQIAILANKDDGIAVHADEWSAFQLFREFTKKLTDLVLTQI